MVHLLTSPRGMRPADLFSRNEPWRWMTTESLQEYFAPLSKHPALLAELARSSVDNCRRAAAVLGLDAVLAEKLPAADDAELSKLLHLAAVGVYRQRETVLLLARSRNSQGQTRSGAQASRRGAGSRLVRARRRRARRPPVRRVRSRRPTARSARDRARRRPRQQRRPDREPLGSVVARSRGYKAGLRDRDLRRAPQRG